MFDKAVKVVGLKCSTSILLFVPLLLILLSCKTLPCAADNGCVTDVLVRLFTVFNVIASAFDVIPSLPDTTFNVKSPVNAPPPVKPVPAIT